MVFIDSHCDTIYTIMRYINDGFCNNNTSLLLNDFHIDLRRMHNLGGYIQYFALYCSDADPAMSLKNLARLMDTYFSQIEVLSKYVMH